MKILFIKLGSFSHINNNIHRILETAYPDDEIDVIDVLYIWKHKIPFYHFVLNIYYFIMEYGADILSGKKKIRGTLPWFFGTSYLARQTSRIIKKTSKGIKYKFTFQTQSLFNGKLQGIPHFVYTDHTTKANQLYPDISPAQYVMSKRFIENIESKIYQNATIIFTFGSLISWSLLNQYYVPAEKVITVFPGSNVTNLNTAKPAKYNSKNILFVGVDWERKGGPILLKVFKNVLTRFPEASLTIIGCKPAINLIPNCNVIGKIPLASLPEYYNAANVFCLPSLRDPFPNVLIEAMNYQLPIVANNIGGIPDMVINEYNGFIIDNNVMEYTKAICSLFEDPEKCKKMGENGYHYAQSKFDWELVKKKMKTTIDKWV